MITASDAIRLSKWRDELHSLEEQAAAAWFGGAGGRVGGGGVHQGWI